MKSLKVLVLLALAAFFLPNPAASAQATPTATQGLQLSAFGAGSGVYTGLLGGRNISFTAGVDLSFRPIRGFYPSLEVRGTYPIHRGQIASEKDALGGIRVEHPIGHLHPYLDFLAGRGEIEYQNGGYTVHTLTYLTTRLQRLFPRRRSRHRPLPSPLPEGRLPVPALEHPRHRLRLSSLSVITVGVVYRFDFNHSYRRQRHPASTESLLLPVDNPRLTLKSH